MKWSLKVGRILGIDVYLHFTFLLLLGFLGFVTWQSTGSVDAAVNGVVFIATLFGCVLLHEFGHALMARRYGIKTSDITLLPIGGIARLERMPEKPRQELWVALAGPAVNLAIAAFLFVVAGGCGWIRVHPGSQPYQRLRLQRLMTVNLVLVAFNLLPAFPMDGGRVLRALLAVRLGRRRATAIAANVGQAMAILFGVVGFFYNPFLIFIAIFVFLGAQAEAGLVEMQSALKGLRVRDAMMTRFRTLASARTPWAGSGRTARRLAAGLSDHRAGSAHRHPPPQRSRQGPGRAIAGDTAVGEVMCRECDSVEAAASLQRTSPPCRPATAPPCLWCRTTGSSVC